MGRHRTRIILGAVTGAVLLAAVAGLAMTSGSTSHGVRLSTSGGPAPVANALPGTDPGADTTTTVETPTSTASPSSTPPTTERLTRKTALTTTTAPTAATPSTTSGPAGPDATHARITVVNQYDRPVHVGVSNATSNEWIIQPGGTTQPWDIELVDRGDGIGTHPVGDETCGTGDNDRYFYGGHTVRIVVTTGTSVCNDGSAGPKLTIYDLTAGTTRVSP